jgi:hypothetical protein
MTVKEMEPVRATASALFLSFPFFASGVRSDRRRVKRSTPLAPKARTRLCQSRQVLGKHALKLCPVDLSLT